jgi:AbiTii
VSLLYEIPAAATGTDVPVEVLLRKVLILATRLGHEPMKEWVTHELDGYPDGVQLPPYRAGYPTLLKGNFMNAAWQATGHVVPMTALPEGLRDLETKMDFREGVGRVREMAEQAKDGVLRMAAPPGLNAYVRLYEGMQCTSLWIETSAGALTNIMEQVRNRVLASALEIEQANSLAGEDSGGGNGGPIPEATVAQIQHHHLRGRQCCRGGVGLCVAGGRDFGPVRDDLPIASSQYPTDHPP